MEEEDIFLVIIGDDSNAEKLHKNLNLNAVEYKIKSKEPVESIINKATQFGEFIENNEIKQEPLWDDLNAEEEYLDIEHEDAATSSTENDGDLFFDTNRPLVTQLRNSYPELKDEEYMVDILKEVMKTVKPPALPPNHYKKLDLNRCKCTICNHITESVAAAGRHYEERHGPRYLFCYACSADFRSKTNLYKHEKICSHPDAAVVLKARALYLGRNSGKRPYIIDKYLEKKKEARSANHDENSTNIDDDLLSKTKFDLPFQCRHCNAAYQKLTGLKQHIKTQHSNNEYICDYCSRAFKKKDTLITHMNTHLPQKKYGCDECPKRYATKFALNIHINRIHKNQPPPCVCTVCLKRFNRIADLKVHMQKFHGVTIMTKTMLMRQLPLMDQPLIRDAKLITKQELEKLRKETEAKYYEEQQKLELERTSKPRLSCVFCDKCYVHKVDLKYHMNSHHLGKQEHVICIICNKKYLRHELLKKHMKRQHGMVIMAPEQFKQNIHNLTKKQVEEAQVVLKKNREHNIVTPS